MRKCIVCAVRLHNQVPLSLRFREIWLPGQARAEPFDIAPDLGLAAIPRQRCFHSQRVPSVVDGITGFQVETFEQMLNRLQLLIQNADLRRTMSAAATTHSRQYDWDQIAARWEAAFDRELQKNS